MSVFLDGHVRDAQQAARGEGALSRPGARVRRQPHRAAAGQHRAEHRDQLAAPRPDQRPEAHQLAHLLDRLPDPRVGRRADEDAHPPFAARRARPPTTDTADLTRWSPTMLSLADIELLFARHGASAVQRRAGHPARARAADARTWPSSRAPTTRWSPPACCTTSATCCNDAGRDAVAARRRRHCTSTSRCRSCAACSATRCSTPIKLHVDAKRYLCARQRGATTRACRDDSKRSLALQGGVFDADAGRGLPRAARRAATRCCCACGTTSRSRPTCATPPLAHFLDAPRAARWPGEPPPDR